jgi:transposase
MGGNYRRYRLVTHSLSAQQRNDRLKQWPELLEVPQNAKGPPWRFILMGDEFWFFYINEHQKSWLAPNSDSQEVARRRINTPKMIVTLFWNISGLHVSNFLAGESFDADYFTRNVLIPIHHLPIVDVAHTQKKRLILHMDNSLMHKSKVTKAKLSQMPVRLAPHPSYSPDLAPSDFFLFGSRKTKVIGLEFDSQEALLDWINAEFQRIPSEVLREFLRAGPFVSRNALSRKVILFLKTK